MAASISGLKLNLNSTRCLDSMRSGAAGNNGKRRQVVWVKAMGGGGSGAKFKGTQMREKQLTEMIENKVMEAKEACDGDRRSDECKVAWDEVEEVSRAKADLRLKLERDGNSKRFSCSNFCKG